MYLDFNRIMSYPALFKFVIAERGVGKSYGAKKWIINHFKKTKKQFMWLRRYSTDLDSAIGNNQNKNFFTQLKDIYNLDDFSITEDNKIKYLSFKDKVMGYATYFRGAESIKGTSFDNVDTIIVDEFLVGDGGSRYLKDEVMFILSIYETISRTRDVQIIFLGNSTSIYNPYFQFFNIHLPYNSQYQTFKNGNILVAYLQNMEYRNFKKQTKFGQIVQNTKYENYAIDNQFINDNNDFIRKKHKNAKLFFNLKYNNNYLGIWSYKNNLYISDKFNINYKAVITFNLKDHNEKTLMIKSSSVFIKNLINHFKIGTLFFENQTIKHQILELLETLHLLY